jgi:hypothetical protein
MTTECVETQEWLEEEVWKPVDDWVEKVDDWVEKTECKKRPWYDPRRWLCWPVTTFVHVISPTPRLRASITQQVGQHDGQVSIGATQDFADSYWGA